MTEKARSIARMPLTVRYHECDHQGVVFNAHYLAYADMASFACLNALFGSHANLRDAGVDLVVAESNVRYRAACRFEDELSIDTFVEHIGTTSTVLRFDMRRSTEQVAEVTNRYVWVDTRQLRPVAPPAWVHDAFARFLPADSRTWAADSRTWAADSDRYE